VNFFDAQDRARQASRRLVAAYIVATILIVLGVTAIVGIALFNFSQAGYGLTVGDFVAQQAPILIGTAILTTFLILGSSLFKTSVLSAGGGRVATSMGGTLVPADVQDPLRRRLRNVVEEMAIASGVPVPEIYVLEEESSINAFAAGFTPSDAAVAVTRGTLELLDRNELQGVIAHEFSHILNGDMRLNIRLMGVLYGIMVLGLIGRLIVRGEPK
jgi:Zn-dependent protease with chaperone function